jgi:hypothetical protein
MRQTVHDDNDSEDPDMRERHMNNGPSERTVFNGDEHGYARPGGISSRQSADYYSQDLRSIDEGVRRSCLGLVTTASRCRRLLQDSRPCPVGMVMLVPEECRMGIGGGAKEEGEQSQ